MVDTVTVKGKKLKARTCTAREWFDLTDQYDKERDFNAALMALCVVDSKGKQVFTKDTAEDLSLPDWQRLERLVTRANNAQDDPGKG